MIHLKEKIQYSIKNQFPFVLFRNPNQKKGTAYFQQNTTSYFLDDSLDNGFVFAPFDDKNDALIIPFFKADRFVFVHDLNTTSNKTETIGNVSEIEKEQHKSLVQKGIDFMKVSGVKKVVLSRKEEISTHNFDVFNGYNKLLNNYPNAYVYLWFHPVSGLWMGATPEILLEVKNQQFNVMALAATQEYTNSLDVVWGQKEKQEHQFVVDYIVSKFDRNQLKVSDTYTVRAGNLLHLRADISGEINKCDIKQLIKNLHPTPATCGLPKDVAKEFIIKNESYNRTYYTGFLGEISDNTSSLYVNLRCMKVDLPTKNVALYIGGGITKESNPHDEWLETVAKANTLKKVL